jgi:hypothetical protein
LRLRGYVPIEVMLNPTRRPIQGIEQQVDLVMESFLPRRPRGAPEAICCGYGR